MEPVRSFHLVPLFRAKVFHHKALSNTCLLAWGGSALDAMRYWITTHWPQRIDDDASNIGSGVYVPGGRQRAANGMAAGDMLVVYETRNGRTKIQVHQDGSRTEIPCKQGREGMICYGTIEAAIAADPESEATSYNDGTEIWWRWYAPVSVLSRSGFIPRPRVLELLGYNTDWNLRGFGDYHSGLKEISKEVFDQLVREFHGARPINLPPKGAGGRLGNYGGGEGETHLNLKNYVAANPAAALNEPGLTTIGVEYEFSTNDRADIVLVDEHNRIIVVEIEPAVEDDLTGLLQAIKYRYMLECFTEREPGDSRGILVAHRISQKAQHICERYGIEYREISHDEVAKWLNRKSN